MSERAAFFGSAFGDALGRATEFSGMSRILERWPPRGPNAPDSEPWLVTDDTQLAIAVANALRSSFPDHRSVETLAGNLVTEFVRWNKSAENNRAPGRTCLMACDILASGASWKTSGLRTSKGCGANMRVTPLALVPGLSRTELSRFSQLQSLLTHSHPTALAASDMTSFAIRLLLDGTPHSQLISRLLEDLADRRDVVFEEFGNFWQTPLATSFQNYMARGWDEVQSVLMNVANRIDDWDGEPDPCRYAGEGWIAEESLACALFSFLCFPNDSVAAIQFAAASSGDSDSIACLTGALVGAYNGDDSFPKSWYQLIEHAEQIEEFMLFIDSTMK